MSIFKSKMDEAERQSRAKVFVSQILNSEWDTEFESIILRRCFNGWEKIKDKYHRPGCDGDIILLIPKQFSGDIQDAKTIIKFLQGDK